MTPSREHVSNGYVGEPSEEAERSARIMVVGVGGGGCNAVARMAQADVRGVELAALNTDAQHLKKIQAHYRIHLGSKVSRGLGAGGNPTVGAKAAEESADALYELFRDTDMIFIAAGMGGGTGTGAAPRVAQIAQEVGALTVAVVTRPFRYEGEKRRAVAEEGINQLKEHVDALIVIPNDRLLQVVDKKVSLEQALRIADEVLYQGIRGIAELITLPGLINVDFADVKAIMSRAGSALMSIGEGTGENRAIEAAKAAISSRLLDVKIDGAKGVLYNVTGGTDLTIHEVHDAAEIIANAADPKANIIFGAAINPELDGVVRITLIATGLEGRSSESSIVRALPLSEQTETRKADGWREMPTLDEAEIELPSFLQRFRRA